MICHKYSSMITGPTDNSEIQALSITRAIRKFISKCPIALKIDNHIRYKVKFHNWKI